MFQGCLGLQVLHVGRGVVAQTKSGKQILNTRGDAVAKICHDICGDHVAVVGENRKVLIFPICEIPEMVRGKGVRLQKYKEGSLSDITTFDLSDGLSWLDPAGRTRTETNLEEWIGKRATAGRMAPRGFPRNKKF
jgi:topoisomerase-4 subunit A